MIRKHFKYYYLANTDKFMANGFSLKEFMSIDNIELQFAYIRV